MEDFTRIMAGIIVAAIIIAMAGVTLFAIGFFVAWGASYGWS